jgi:hypothetical protein
MNSATATTARRPKPDRGSLLQGNTPDRREPVWLDGMIFFVGIPVAIAFIFSLVGIRLIADMPYPDALLYMILHMLVAWWSIGWVATGLKLAFRSWRPPVLVICTLGFFLSLIPAAFLFNALGDFYSEMYPAFADNRADAAPPGWRLDYLLHFIRYSIPALPLFLSGVYVYRLVTGVDWFGYPAQVDTAATPQIRAEQRATAGLIEGLNLPAEATILAAKAEQHYVQVWSDRGKDLVRYRFKDLPIVLGRCNGAQVHRSWWVNFDAVRNTRQSGRTIELVISDELVVPVSLSFKNSVLSTLGKAPGPEQAN